MMAAHDDATLRRPLRIWPGVVAGLLLLLVRFGVPVVAPGFEGFRVAIFGGFLGILAVLVWWVFFSRAPHSRRWGVIGSTLIVLAATWRANHESMGLVWLLFYALPLVSLAGVAWAVASRRLSAATRRVTWVATLVLVCGVWTLVRMDGLTGDHAFQFAWRWTETDEERLLAQAGDGPAAATPPAPSIPPNPLPAAAAERGASWPGFRGPGRDGVVPGVCIEADWSASPPVELWRRTVGPGWSSFAVEGALLYTQEQRGDEEVVACYRLGDGEQVWMHRDPARFFESMGGVGPRATPTVHDGQLYTLGATGILNAFDAADGSLLWSRNVAADTESRVPIWGFSSSPLVLDDLLIVAAAGALGGYELAGGEPRWFGPDGGHSYSSPHLTTLAGVPQILLLSHAGLASVVPLDGRLLWEHSWPGVSLVQPALTAGGGVLLSAGEGKGVRRIDVVREGGEWTVAERWTSNRLKPNFNDFVVHRGHAYGFDGRMLACMDVEDGERRWKGGRYGHGQLVLLAEQALLLVLSEQGELALVEADPGGFTELARFPAIQGKTWNHPVLVGQVLLVRNGQEMAAFRLAIC